MPAETVTIIFVAVITLEVFVFILYLAIERKSKRQLEGRRFRPQSIRGLYSMEKWNEENEVSEAYQRQAFWECSGCGQEFRLPGGKTPPVRCPNCGDWRLTGAEDFGSDGLVRENGASSEEDAKTFTCPSCKARVEMLNGEPPDYCPVCSKDMDEDKWSEIVERQPFWTCFSCSTEFRLSSMPIRCPSCGDKLKIGTMIPDEEADVATYTCPACHAPVDMLDGDELSYCPCCGIELPEGERGNE